MSEPAACPYCTQTEFGVTYEPPPFRRGLVYNGQAGNHLGSATSAMSSTTSLNSPTSVGTGRRRATSLAVTDKTVITTDMVRPDWAKKLADAKAHTLRRAAAATALHNAAYMMGNLPQGESRFGIGRRRRLFTTDSGGSSGNGTPRREGESSSGQPGSSGDLFPNRISSRRGNRLEDLEELMMMEAIRLSLAAEEERKKKDEKEAAKEAKKEEKKKAKENKKVAKAQRNIGSGFHPIDIDGLDGTEAGSSAAAGKGKGIDRSGGVESSHSKSDLTSTLHASPSRDDAQGHLEASRAQIQRETSDSANSGTLDTHSNEQQSHRAVLRNLSNASSSASSCSESYQNSLRHDNHNAAPGSSYSPSLNPSSETPPQGPSGTEPMFNFQSLKEAISPEEENKSENKAQFIEDVGENKSLGDSMGPTPEVSEPLSDSTATFKPNEDSSTASHAQDGAGDSISPVPRVELVSDEPSHLDQKHIGEVSMTHELRHQHATQ